MEAASEDAKNAHLQDLQDLQHSRRGICFEARITATSSPFLNKYAKLTVPIWFMRQHGEKMQENVKLISRATGRTWTVEVVVYHPHWRPQVMLCRGWSAFASFNCLVEGDQLTFTLTAMSEFEVGISRMPFPCIPRSKRVKSSRRGMPIASPECKAERLRAEENDELFVIGCTQPKKKSNVLHVADSEYTDDIESVNKSQLLAARFARESALERGNSNETLPKVKSKEKVTSSYRGDCLWNWIEETTNHVSEYKEDAPRRKLQNSHPRFFKKLTRSHCYLLEIPCIFAKTYGTRLDRFVTLRWFHRESPVYNVACTWRLDRDKRRISFTDGWKEFKTENGLQAGQELEFILIADSSFVVRLRGRS